ncbi:SDR family NAD(P)-dependent oxidoreductase [Vibrio harveyi]|uniref:SDR family NAD(P)-dependent oxidoreductase n=1 Tax=Vibrio harveyi TaxID=669 RepID=UPI00390BFDD1
MNLNLENKIAVVTGGSKGIGAAIVESFVNEGATVHFCARNESEINAFLEKNNNNNKIKPTVLDVNDQSAFKDWINSIGAIDIFIPNVSALSDDWNDSIKVDLTTTIENIKAVIPMLVNKDAAVTFIGSESSYTHKPDTEAYGAIKAALTYHIKCLALTHANKIRFNVVAPSSVLSPDNGWDKFRQECPERYREKELALPLERLATAKEVADVVVFVSSPVSSYVVGATIHVNGGAMIAN